MSMVIANNMSAVNTKRQFSTSGLGMSRAMEKLSSGYKINTGKDDPSGLVISEKLRSQLNGLKRAQQNTEEGINVMGIAEGALNEMNSILKKMKALAIHSNNTGVTSPEQVAADQAEMDSAIQTLDRIAQTTKFSDENLLNGSKDIAYETTTSTKGTQQNSLLNARESEFSQIFKRDGFAVSLSFTGTTQADELTGTGEVDFSQQAMKAYLEVDTSKDATNMAQVADGKFTQDQQFTITGSKGSRAFSFKQGATVADMVSQIHSAADSTGIDAALVFNSDQKIDMTLTGAASEAALGAAGFKIDGINSSNGNAVNFKLNPTEDLVAAMEDMKLANLNISASIRGNAADGTQEIILRDDTLGINLTTAWDGKSSTLSSALRAAADNESAVTQPGAQHKALLNALADGGLTASADISVDDSVVPTTYDINAGTDAATSIVIENIFGSELSDGSANGSVKIDLTQAQMDAAMTAIKDNLASDPTKQKAFINDLNAGKLQITAKAVGSTSDFNIALSIGNGTTTYGTQNVKVELAGTTDATDLAGKYDTDNAVTSTVAGGIFSGATITVNDADLSGFGYDAGKAVVSGGAVVASIPAATRQTAQHTISTVDIVAGGAIDTDAKLTADDTKLVGLTIANVLADAAGVVNLDLKFDLNFASELTADDVIAMTNMNINIMQEEGHSESAPKFTISVSGIGGKDYTLMQGWDGNMANAKFDFSKITSGGQPVASNDPDYELLNRVFNGASLSGAGIAGAMGGGVVDATGAAVKIEFGDSTGSEFKAVQEAAAGSGNALQIGVELAGDIADMSDLSAAKFKITMTDGASNYTSTETYTAAQLAQGVEGFTLTEAGTANAALKDAFSALTVKTGKEIDVLQTYAADVKFDAADKTALETAVKGFSLDSIFGGAAGAGKITITGNMAAAGGDGTEQLEDLYAVLNATEKVSFLKALDEGTLKLTAAATTTDPTTSTSVAFTLTDGTTSFYTETVAVAGDVSAAGTSKAFDTTDTATKTAGLFNGLTVALSPDSAAVAATPIANGAGNAAVGGIKASVAAADANAAADTLTAAINVAAADFRSLADPDVYATSVFAGHLTGRAVSSDAMTVYEGAYDYDREGTDESAEYGKVQVKFDKFDSAGLSGLNTKLANILGGGNASITAQFDSTPGVAAGDPPTNYMSITIADSVTGDVGATIKIDMADLAANGFLDVNGETGDWVDLGDVIQAAGYDIDGANGAGDAADGAFWKGLKVNITNLIPKAGFETGKLAAGDNAPAAVTDVVATATASATDATTVAFTSTGAAGQVGGTATDGSAARNAGTVAVFNNVTKMTDIANKATDGSIEKGITGVTFGNGAADSVQLGQNTDGQGRIFVKFLDDNSYELYKDSSMSKESLVATGVNGKAVNQANNSGLEGITLDLTGSELTKVNGVYISVAGIEGQSTNDDGVTNGVSYTGNLVNDPATALFDKDRSYMTGVELGKNTDANGKLHMRASFDKETGTLKVQAFKDANMRAEDLVAESDTILTNGAESMTVVLNEARNADNTAGTGLGIVLSMASGDVLEGFDKDMTLTSVVEYKNLGARMFAQDYGSANSVKITQDKGRVFSYYGSAGQNTSKEMVDAGANGITVQVAGQDATLSINGAQVKTNGLELSMATQDIQANLVFNAGAVGSTTLAQVGYDTGSIFTKIGALNLGSVEAETEGKYAGLSGLMANAGHVTNETADNFQGGMQLQLGEGAGDQNRTIVAIKSVTSENLGRVTQGGYWETGSAVYSERTFTMKDVMGGGLASLSQRPTLAMAIIEQGISDVSELRAQIGAVQTNMLQTNSNNLAVTMENIQKTESGIRDADMADEMTEFTKNQVLQGAAMSMMSQANQQSQSVLQLLR